MTMPQQHWPLNRRSPSALRHVRRMARPNAETSHSGRQNERPHSILKSRVPDCGTGVVPLMLPVVVTEEMFAVVLANSDPEVVPLMLLVAVKGGAFNVSAMAGSFKTCPGRRGAPLS